MQKKQNKNKKTKTKTKQTRWLELSLFHECKGRSGHLGRSQKYLCHGFLSLLTFYQEKIFPVGNSGFSKLHLEIKLRNMDQQPKITVFYRLWCKFLTSLQLHTLYSPFLAQIWGASFSETGPLLHISFAKKKKSPPPY